MISDYNYKPIFYFSMTFLATYVLWFAGAYVSFQENISSLTYLFMLPGLMAPFLISVVMIGRSKNSDLKSDFVNRLFNLRLIQPKMLPVFILIMPFSVLASIIISLSFGESISQFQLSEGFSFSSGFVPVLLLLLLAATFEELGWRGYAFDSLQSRYNYLTASIIFSLLWSLWHFPLIFVKDSYQYEIFHQNIWFGVNFFVKHHPNGDNYKLDMFKKRQKRDCGDRLSFYYQYVPGNSRNNPNDKMYPNRGSHYCGGCDCYNGKRDVFLERPPLFKDYHIKNHGTFNVLLKLVVL
jgi:membrane protease YdiL (CAAX protease family)